MNERFRISKERDENGDASRWSELSVVEQPVEQLYGKTEDETDEEYRDRLDFLEEEREEDRMSSAERKQRFSRQIYNADGADPDAEARELMKKRGVSELMRFCIPNDLKDIDRGKYGLEEFEAQCKKLEWYIGRVEKYKPRLSDRAFRAVYSREDESYTEYLRQLFAQREEMEEKGIPKHQRTRFWNKGLEAMLYVTAQYGFFDSKDKIARPIWASEYDDYTHGVDCAFQIPCGDEYVNIAIDCTAATSEKAVAQKFNEKHIIKPGLPEIYSRMKYAKTVNGEKAPEKALHYVIGVDRSVVQRLLKRDNIEKVGADAELKKIIFLQLFLESAAKENYLSEERGKHLEKMEDYDKALREAKAIETFSVEKLQEFSSFNMPGALTTTQQRVLQHLT